MNASVLKSWWILLTVLVGMAIASPYGRYLDNYGDEQITRGVFPEEAFVLSKRDKPTPNSVARLARMHSTVGIGKRGPHDTGTFLDGPVKLGETPAKGAHSWSQSAPPRSADVSVANIDRFANDMAKLIEVFRTCPHALKYVAESSGAWKADHLKDLLNTCLNVAVLARKMSGLS